MQSSIARWIGLSLVLTIGCTGGNPDFEPVAEEGGSAPADLSGLDNLDLGQDPGRGMDAGHPPDLHPGDLRPQGGGMAPVGAPCTADSDCATGQCLTHAQDRRYAGGYCTVKMCDRRRNPCPMGSECDGLAQGGLRICLAECTGPHECRTGYGCCSGPGPMRPPAWCAPTSSLLCTAR